MLDQTSIARKVAELGKQITADYEDKSPVMIGVLKGCIVFLADLMRQIKVPLELEFVSAASYRSGTTQAKEILFSSPVSIPLKGRNILLVEGVVDSGRTVVEVMKTLAKQEPASVEIVTLIDKPASHRTKLDIKYKCFTIGNEFVIGYGLDNTQKYRNLPFIGSVIDTK